MKKTDVAMLILIAGVSVFISYAVVNSLPFFQDANEPITIKTIDQIDPKISGVDDDSFEKVFDDDAINPTVEVLIGTDAALDQANGDSSFSVDTTLVPEDGQE